MTPAEILADREHVLLDFDGPVCAVFSGISDQEVADHLRSLLHGDLPADIASSRDPFDLLRYVRALPGSVGQVIEREFLEQELAAVAIAVETPGALEAVRALSVSGHTITIVSNNSTAAVRAYLSRHELGQYIHEVSARHPEQQTPLKPDPFLLRQAMLQLGTSPAACCMIGDSIADIEAAHALEVPVIAYANKPGKANLFRQHGAELVLGTMTELATPR